MSQPNPTRPDVLSFLRRQALTEKLSEAELQALVSVAEHRLCADGEVIVQEGEHPDALFVVLRGRVDVSKNVTYLPDPDDEYPDEQTLTQLGEGAMLGELSFLDGEPASATLRASGPCELLRVTRQGLAQAASMTPTLEDKLSVAIARVMVRRLRAINQSHVEALHQRLQQAHLRNQFAIFFVITLVLFGIASAVQKLINPGLPPLLQMLYSWGLLLVTFAPIGWFAWRLRLSPRTWGLSWRNAGRSVRESLVLTAGMVALAVGWRWLSRAPQEPFVTWGSLANYSPVEFAAFFVAYGPHSFLQEFIGRGVIQGALTRFLPEFRPEVPVVLTSALFGIFHLYVSVAFALITFVASLVFGMLYRRHGTLVGVTVLHYFIGCVSVSLGFN